MWRHVGLSISLLTTRPWLFEIKESFELRLHKLCTFHLKHVLLALKKTVTSGSTHIESMTFTDLQMYIVLGLTLDLHGLA